MHDLASRLPVTDNESVGNVVNDLQAEVAAARAARAELERHHERVKELLIQARLQDRKLGPKVLEQMTDGYFDRDTISRITSPALAARTAA